MVHYVDKSSVIKDSHKLCRQNNLDPTVIPRFISIPGDELEQKLTGYEEILSVAGFFFKQFLDSIQGKGIPLLISISNEEGVILKIDGDQSIKEMMNEAGFRVGIQFVEECAGTNVVNLALKHQSPIELIGEEHYHHLFHHSACYSVPFYYQKENNLLGTISIMTDVAYEHPFFLAMLVAMVESIERELQLQKQNSRLDVLNHILIDTTRNAIVATDTDGMILEFNTVAEKLTNLQKEAVIGQPITCIDHLCVYIEQVLKEGKKFEDIHLSSMDSATQRKVVCQLDALPIHDLKGNLIGALGQFRDITERVETEEKIKYMAHHDELTGLPNRRLFKERFVCEVERAVGFKEKLAIVFIDLDRFKSINDTFGHTKGDLLLKQVSERLKSCSISDKDMVARMGGDEFIFILPQRNSKESIFQHTEQILSSFDQPFVINEQALHVSASIGIAIFPDDGEDVETLMVYADSAMYKAKAAGGNKIQFFNPDMYSNAHKKLLLENALRKSLENKELFLEYQPQVDAKTGQLLGAEALLRWKHPQLGIIPPAEFIPISEETGFIIPIGEWVLREACSQNKRWQDAGYPPVKMSVNLSGKQFSQDTLLEDVKRILKETKLTAKFLDLEITESMMMDVEHSIQILNELCSLGIQISIDDFGTEYSSLNYLKRFPIHRLKIDRSFMKEVITNTSDASIVETIIAMAHHLGLDVIAEGVETKEQLEFLVSKDCDEIQGYLFSKPISARDFEEQFLKKL